MLVFFYLFDFPGHFLELLFEQLVLALDFLEMRVFVLFADLRTLALLEAVGV